MPMALRDASAVMTLLLSQRLYEISSPARWIGCSDGNSQKPALKKARVFIRNGVVNKASRISRKSLIQLEMPRLPIVDHR